MKALKQVVSRSHWLIVAILLNAVIVTVNCAAIEPHKNTDHDPQDHDHSGEHGGSAELVETSLKSHGEDCSGDGVKCNEKEGLICMQDVGKCECAVGLAFSDTSGKCLEAPPPAIHDPSNELTEEHEHDLEHHSEPDALTTTASKHQADSVQIAEVHHSHSADENDHEVEDAGHKHVAKKCENSDCIKDLGKYSKCDEDTGECICDDTDKQNRAVELIKGKCFLERKINDPCTSHEECSATIKGKAWCHMDIETMKRFCQCEVFNYFDDNLRECLPFAHDGLFSPCKTDFQCTGFEKTPTGHGLGANSKCSQDSGVCECKLGHNGEKGYLYENYCFYHLKIDDPCSFDRECQVSDPNTFCSNETQTCQRLANPMNLDGRSMGDGQGHPEAENDGLISSLKAAMGIEVPNFVFIMIIAAVVVLAVVILSLFILKKRHKYAIVRTRDTSDPNHM